MVIREPPMKHFNRVLFCSQSVIILNFCFINATWFSNIKDHFLPMLQWIWTKVTIRICLNVIEKKDAKCLSKAYAIFSLIIDTVLKYIMFLCHFHNTFVRYMYLEITVFSYREKYHSKINIYFPQYFCLWYQYKSNITYISIIS